MKNELLIALYKKPQTVFSLKDVSLLFPEIPYNNLKARMSYFVKSGSIRKLGRGIFTKDQFNILELANKLYVPSYISLETVLRKAGVIFQHYENIFAISYVSRTAEAGGYTITYRRMKKEILLNRKGINEEENVIIASPERAFLDAVFLYKNYHFDNLDTLKWDKIMDLKNLYKNRIFSKRIEEYYRDYREDHA